MEDIKNKWKIEERNNKYYLLHINYGKNITAKWHVHKVSEDIEELNMYINKYKDLQFK